MEYKEYRTVDKTNWKRGPWDDEPDKVQFVTANGMPALVVRGPFGALCGYVGVSSNHPFFGKKWDDIDVSVHGGITFTNKCDPHPEAEKKGICHLVEEGEDDNIWWLGFDCGHSYDFCPAYDLPGFGFYGQSYKNLAYVKREIENLSIQCASVAQQM